MTPEPHELQELVQELHQQGSPWLPAGMGSRLSWGPVVSQPHQVVSCRRLDRILHLNPGDFTISVEAGAPLVDVQRALSLHGQWLPLDWPWGSQTSGLGSGSIGGLLARGHAGGYRHRYLGVRDQLLGIELIRSDGVKAKAGGKVVKNVAGYDLMRLLCGSWGSLALISSATLRTQPIPPERLGLLLRGALLSQEAFCQWLLDSSLAPERVDWQRNHRECNLIISLASISAQTLQEQLTCMEDKANDHGLELQCLDAASLAATIAKPGPGEPLDPAWLLRVGVRPVHASSLIRAQEFQDLELDLGAATGLGYMWGDSETIPPYRIEALRQFCQDRGGYMTLLRQPPGSRMAAWLDAPSRSIIEAIKRQFDPKQQLARGRLPGVAPLHR